MPGSQPLHEPCSCGRGEPRWRDPWQATRIGTAEACHRRLRLRRVGSYPRRPDYPSSRECCVPRWDKWTEQPLVGVPLGLGGGGSSAAHATYGILTGRSVCQRRGAVLRGRNLNVEVEKRDIGQWVGFRGGRKCPNGHSIELAVASGFHSRAVSASF